MVSITEDIRTLAELTAEPLAIVKQARQSGRPIVITAKGKADVVILDAAVYEKHLKAANLLQLLAPAEADVRAGRTRPVSEFFAEFERAKKVSR